MLIAGLIAAALTWHDNPVFSVLFVLLPVFSILMVRRIRRKGREEDERYQNDISVRR
jgi:membrane protein implicated in regulation of membrane protease activity